MKGALKITYCLLLLCALAGCGEPVQPVGDTEAPERRVNAVCVGLDGDGSVITIPTTFDGSCAPGFDLRTWT